MPAKKTQLKRSTSFLETPMSVPVTTAPLAKPSRKGLYLILLLILVAAFLLTRKGLLIAAVVNGRPIFRWDLNKVLEQRFGKQTLEGMISESLIADAAKKQNVEITPADVDAKEQSIVKSLGANVQIEELLKYQGMSKEDFDNQVRLQLTVQRVLGKDIQITDDDVNNYIATNRATLVATEEAKLRDEAKQAILDQKVSEKVQAWFAELKAKAKISRFL